MKRHSPYYILFFGVIISLFIIACSNDENTQNDTATDTEENEQNGDENQEVTLPSDFVISFSDITHDAAKISWTESTNEMESNITYAVFVNEEPIVDDLAELEYLIEDLSYNTTYDVRVVANDEYGSTPSMENFTTLGIPNLRLSRYNRSVNDIYTNEFLISFEYDENQNLIAQNDNSNWINFIYEYENEKITHERHIGQMPVRGRIYYRYENGLLSQVEYESGYEYTVWIIYDFDPDQTFYKTTYILPCNNCDCEPAPLCHYNRTYSNYVVMNSNNYPLSVEMVDDQTGETFLLQFKYTNGNLTKIMDQDNNIWEILYDDKNHFRTFPNHSNIYLNFFHFNIPTSSGNGEISLFDPNLDEYIDRTPLFNNYLPSNNVVAVKKNGNLFREFFYEYNEFDYPSKVTFPITEGLELNFEYEYYYD